MTGWPAVILCAIALLLASGCTIQRYPISERIVIVPLEAKCRCKQPTTKPAPPPKIALSPAIR